jgi:hypothetical protein
MAHERPKAFMGERTFSLGQFVRAEQLAYG